MQKKRAFLILIVLALALLTVSTRDQTGRSGNLLLSVVSPGYPVFSTALDPAAPCAQESIFYLSYPAKCMTPDGLRVANPVPGSILPVLRPER